MTHPNPNRNDGQHEIARKNVLNNIGCSISEDVLVDVYDPPFVSAGADLWIHYGDIVELQG